MKTFKQFFNDVDKVSKAIIYKKGRILMLKKPNGWELPGGHLTRGESFDEGLNREVYEETRLRLQMYEPVGGTDKVALFFVTGFSGKIKLSNEHTKYKWFDLRQLSKKKLTNSTNSFLPTILKTVQSV